MGKAEGPMNGSEKRKRIAGKRRNRSGARTHRLSAAYAEIAADTDREAEAVLSPHDRHRVEIAIRIQLGIVA